MKWLLQTIENMVLSGESILADGVPQERRITMAKELEPSAPRDWRTIQVYSMASACLVIGIALGYLFRGSGSVRVPTAPSTTAATSAPAAAMPQMPSLDDMKRMADKKAEPLLARLKTDPRNSTLLNQIGTLYKATHQFKEAADYYQKALDADPKNVPARIDLASCLFYQGDTDGALSQLQQSLRYDPKDANALFNLGMIRLQGKNDPDGAVTAWQKLLKSNPTLPQEKKAAVEKLIAQAQLAESQKLSGGNQ
jgi:cytochrome c-type biogenesis protein CcmH/NrfG